MSSLYFELMSADSKSNQTALILGDFCGFSFELLKC